MKRVLPAALLALLVSCQSNGNQPNGTPKYKEGDLISFTLTTGDGQIVTTDCQAKNPCRYKVRYEAADRTLQEGDFKEFEIQPARQPRSDNANMRR
jgi:hypothetical protein